MTSILIVFAIVIVILLISKLSDWLKNLVNKRYNENAKIINVKTRMAGHKPSRHYRTYVKFDDGFVYVSDDTERVDHVFTYEISINSGMITQIIEEALIAHAKATGKPFRTTNYMCNKCSLRMPYTCACPACGNEITEKDYHPLDT